MSTSAVGGSLDQLLAQQRATAGSQGPDKFAAMSSNEFVRIMISELTNQDPFKPNDSAQILEQLSSLRNIESQLSLQRELSNLVLQNQIAQASGMIGKMVQGLDESNTRIQGMVTSVKIADGKVSLELDTGKRLPMTRLEAIVKPQG